jgi:hypothetical protein
MKTTIYNQKIQVPLSTNICFPFFGILKKSRMKFIDQHYKRKQNE